jgi:hypothetical protein
MPITLHERLRKFESSNGFYLLTKHRLVVGRIVKKEFTITYPGEQLPTTPSIEPNGTFQVFLYPDHFTEKIDQIIVDYANLITTPKPRKEPPKKVEKPKPMKQELPPKTASSEPQKKRTRKPVPVFTTRKK